MYLIKKLKILLILFFTTQVVMAQKTISPSILKWYTFEQGMKMAAEVERRPLLIDTYTDWCGWCKRMMGEVFTDPFVCQYITEKFYPVSFNAESKDKIVFNNQVFTDTVIGNTRVHKLALILLDYKTAYPTLVYITRDGRKFAIPGYQQAKGLFPRLVYYAEDIHNSQISYEQFKPIFDDCFPDPKLGAYVKEPDKIKWYTLEEALELNEKNPKRIFLDIYPEKGYASTMMWLKTYNEPRIAAILNEKFYCVRLNANEKRPIKFGETFINKGKETLNFHQIAIAMLNGKMDFPACLFFDNNSKLVHSAQEFMTPELFWKHLRFVSEDFYKTTTWETFKSK